MSIIDKPSDYFNSAIYTGDGSQTRTISGVGFQPDLVIHKIRTGSDQGHSFFDSIRGFAGAKCLQINTTAVEGIANGANAAEYGFVSGVNSDGYTVNDGTAVTNGGYVNRNTYTYVSWNWKAGTSFSNDASGTGIGTIDSTGSANTDAGFSIVSWTGTQTAGTIKHGLSTPPRLIIVKARTQDDGWYSWHIDYDASNNKYQRLEIAGGLGAGTAFWNDTAPTSSVFSVGNSTGTNHSSAMIAYCFADVPSYQKIGKYIGNGNANGSYIHLGFKASFVFFKRIDTGKDGIIHDNKRYPSNQPVAKILKPNTDTQDADTGNIDIFSNGFKLLSTGSNSNANGGTYIYYAIAENPFVTSTGIPTTAR